MTFATALRDSKELDRLAVSLAQNIAACHRICTDAKTEVAGDVWTLLAIKVPGVAYAFDNLLASFAAGGISNSDLAARIADKYAIDTTTLVADVIALQAAMLALLTGIENNMDTLTPSLTSEKIIKFDAAGDLSAGQKAALNGLLDSVLNLFA